MSQAHPFIVPLCVLLMQMMFAKEDQPQDHILQPKDE